MIHRYAAIVCMFLSFAIAAYSQADEQIQRDIQQRIIEEQRQRELDDAMRPPIESQAPESDQTAAPSADDGNCIDINTVSYAGNTKLSKQTIDALIATE